MISLLHFDSPGPVFHGPDIDAFQADHGLPQDVIDMQSQMAKAIAHNYNAAKATLWKHAMTLANGGVLPSHAEIKERAQEVTTVGGVTHLLWDHPPIEMGDDVDMDYCIASIDKPKI